MTEEETSPMPVITVTVDEELKKNAGSILEELGLDIPTAVRMYLKSLLREKNPVLIGDNTPASTAAPVRKKAPAKNASVEDFVALICAVPSGALTRWSDIEAYLSEKAGGEVSVPRGAEWPRVNREGLAIPYWRVVSERGAVRGTPGICTKELQEAMLRAEGYILEEAGHGIFTGLKVAGYKDKLVKF